MNLSAHDDDNFISGHVTETVPFHPESPLLGGYGPSINDTCPSTDPTPAAAAAAADPAGASGVDWFNPERNPFILAWYFQLVYSVAFVAMVTVAAGGNVVVVWIVVAHKRMRTVTNYFLVNLAVADAMISLLNTLFNFVYMIVSDWPFGRSYCKFTQFIAPCNISTSVFTFMAIALDRYMAILHPMKPRMKAGLVVGVICGIWVVSVALSSPTLLYAETYTWQYPSGYTRTVCYLEWPDGVYNTIDFAYNVFFLIVTYFLPLLALAITYTRVGKKLWGSQAIGERTPGQEETIRSKRRVVKMMIVIVVIFGVCWLPQNVFFLVTNPHPEIRNYVYIQHVYLVIYWLAMSNSMYNPIIYCWMNARFRNGFKYVFRWLPCIEWRSCDVLGIRGTTKERGSVSEGTKYTFTFNETRGGVGVGGGGTPSVIGLQQMHSLAAAAVGNSAVVPAPPNDAPLPSGDASDNPASATRRTRAGSAILLAPQGAAAHAARYKHRYQLQNQRKSLECSDGRDDDDYMKL